MDKKPSKLQDWQYHEAMNESFFNIFIEYIRFFSLPFIAYSLCCSSKMHADCRNANCKWFLPPTPHARLQTQQQGFQAQRTIGFQQCNVKHKPRDEDPLKFSIDPTSWKKMDPDMLQTNFLLFLSDLLMMTYTPRQITGSWLDIFFSWKKKYRKK